MTTRTLPQTLLQFHLRVSTTPHVPHSAVTTIYALLFGIIAALAVTPIYLALSLPLAGPLLTAPAVAAAAFLVFTFRAWYESLPESHNLYASQQVATLEPAPPQSAHATPPPIPTTIEV